MKLRKCDETAWIMTRHQGTNRPIEVLIGYTGYTRKNCMRFFWKGMCFHSLEEAKKDGYNPMRFKLVPVK